MDLAKLLGIVKRWWWALLMAVVLAAVAGYVAGENSPHTYESRVRLLVGPLSATDDEVRAASQLTRTYAELVTADAVITQTIESLDLPHTPSELRDAIRPTADSATRLLVIRVRDSDPDRAQQTVSSLADRLRQMAAAPIDSAGRITVVDEADPGTSVGLSSSFLAILAAMAGLLAATTLVLLREYLSERVHEDDELVTLAGVDHLGSLPPQRSLGRGSAAGPVAVAAPDSARARACTILATKIELIADDTGVRSLLVVGVGSGHGAGDVAANLAVVMADRGHRVAVIDANPVSPEVTALFNLAPRPGLVDLRSKVNAQPGSWNGEIDAYTVNTRPRLTVMPVGQGTDGVSDVMPVPNLVDRLRADSNLVVVTTPPAERSAAALAWARGTDATLLVVPGNVRRTDLRRVTETLRLLGAPLIGMVTDGTSRF